ncbi:MAG: D-glycero-beta-D-manno-heptose 1-phosphate adenylyltransferase [Candidatus Sabulitectum sp.]|nr:D-glycero-beta-D-manno-heptose 1-phosphate adenylyltransferase [Candidatus Sabulitectum sp.]
MSDCITRVPVYSAEDAASLACKLREQGKQIVFTNGCFDILHPGHLEILDKSRGMGDCLFVGLNSDDSVERLKGPSRPVQPLESRAAILSSLRSVDCVIPFSEDTPLELIKKILPDVLVKGGDYMARQVVGAETVLKNGGRVEIVPLINGYSTTLIVEKTR